jgi:hypothetical protein
VPEKSLVAATTVVREGRIRLAATLISLGLLVLFMTLLRIHPLAFVAFALIGFPLVLAGILLFLYSVISEDSKAS